MIGGIGGVLLLFRLAAENELRVFIIVVEGAVSVFGILKRRHGASDGQFLVVTSRLCFTIWQRKVTPATLEIYRPVHLSQAAFTVF